MIETRAEEPARVPAWAFAGKTRTRAILLIAVAISAVSGLWLFIDVSKPHGLHLLAGIPAAIRAQCWSVLASWLVASVTYRVMTARSTRMTDPERQERWSDLTRLSTAALLLVPFTVYPLSLLLGHPLVALICVPSTAFGVWSVYRMQRYRRMPVGVPLSAFGWGALVATGAGGGMNILYYDFATRYFVTSKVMNATEHPDIERLRDGSLLHDVLRAGQLVRAYLALDAGVFEELAKGAGIAVLFILFRRWIDGVVSGLVIGATVGLGFNFVESTEYMSAGAAQFQYWARQSIGLMAAHTTFSALVGAAFGVAVGLSDPRRRRLTVACGFLGAIGAHFMTDACMGAVTTFEGGLLPSGEFFQMLVTPLVLITLQGPFVVVYILMLRSAWREQASSFARTLDAEKRNGLGAVTEKEVPILLDPRRRFQLRVLAFRRLGGLDAYRYLGRLQAAQLDLAAYGGREAEDRTAQDEAALRDRVQRLKRNAPFATGTAGTRPVEASA